MHPKKMIETINCINNKIRLANNLDIKLLFFFLAIKTPS